MDQPVTRGELVEVLAAFKTELKAELKTELKAELRADFQTDMKSEIGSLKAELIEVIRDSETKLLKAFFVYQESIDIRFRKISADVSNIGASSELRVNNLEQRITAIEKKLLMEPPAA